MTELIKLHLKLILQKKLFIFLTISISLALGCLSGALVKNTNETMESKLSEKSIDVWKVNTKKIGISTLRAAEEKFKNPVKDARANIYKTGIDNSVEVIMDNWVEFFGNISFPYLLKISMKSSSSAIDQAGLLIWVLLATPFLLPFIGSYIGMLEKQNQIQTLIITSGISKMACLSAKILILAFFSLLTTGLSILGFSLGNGQLSLPTIATNELLTVAISLIFFGSLFVGIVALFFSNLLKEPLTSYFLASSLLPLVFGAIIVYGLGCNTVNSTLQTIKETALSTKIPREDVSKEKIENMVERTVYKEAQLLALKINEEIVPNWANTLTPDDTSPIHKKSTELGILFLALSFIFGLFSLGVINRK